MRLACASIAICLSIASCHSAAVQSDVVVYGATPGGLMAAVEAAKHGRSVTILEPTGWVGGMVTGGLSHTDIGYPNVTGGLAMDLFRAIGERYSNQSNIACWDFEPHVASEAFQDLLSGSKLQVKTNAKLARISTSAGPAGSRSIDSIQTESGDEYKASVWIDGTYEGDLIAASPAETVFGRESSSQYGESSAGVLPPCPGNRYEFQAPVPDHFESDGKTLLPLINAVDPGEVGGADLKVQSMCYRLCMTNVSSNRIPVTKPADYDPHTWELARRYYAAWGKDSLRKAITIHNLPKGKTDWNVGDAVSLDVIGGTWPAPGMPPFYYPNATWAQRQQVIQYHQSYTRGYLWFLMTDPGVPQEMRAEAGTYGYCKDEWESTGGFPPQLYVREGRRMVGEHVLTQHDRADTPTKNDSIAVGSYSLDSHDSQRYAMPSSQAGWVHNEGVHCDLREDSEPESGPGNKLPAWFEIPYRSIVPRREHVTNLLSPVPLSASHVGFASVRLEPTWMALGQAAGLAAHLALEHQERGLEGLREGAVVVQDVDVGRLQAGLRAEGQVVSHEDIGPVPRNVCPNS